MNSLDEVRPHSYWQWALGIIISALCFWLLFRELSFTELKEALGEARYPGLITGFLLIFAIMGARVIRWRILLSPHTYPPRRLLLALLGGQLLNSFLPARGGDLARALLLKGNPAGKTAHILGTIAAEKVWDLGMLLLTAVFLWALMPLPSWFVDFMGVLAVALLVGWVAIVVSLVFRPQWLALLTRALAPVPLPGKKRIILLLDGLVGGLEALRDPRRILGAGFWSMVVWSLGALVNLAVLWAFGVPSLPAAVFLLAALMAGISAPIPSAPGKLGIYEGLVVGVLSLFRIPQAQALAVALVLHAVVLIPPVLVVISLLAGEKFAV